MRHLMFPQSKIQMFDSVRLIRTVSTVCECDRVKRCVLGEYTFHGQRCGKWQVHSGVLHFPDLEHKMFCTQTKPCPADNVGPTPCLFYPLVSSGNCRCKPLPTVEGWKHCHHYTCDIVAHIRLEEKKLEMTLVALFAILKCQQVIV